MSSAIEASSNNADFMIEIEQKIKNIEKKIQDKVVLDAADYKKLYDLAGILYREKYGLQAETNPCSAPSITNTVLHMASSIKPCSLINVGMGGYPQMDASLVKMGFSVCGVEYSHSLTRLAVDNLKANNVSMNCINADGQKLPFADASFEAAVCSETVEHVPDDTAVIREIARVLKPGGILLFTVPCILELHGLRTVLLRWIRREKNLLTHPNHLREYTYGSTKRLVEPFFSIRSWHSVPFTQSSFSKMPYETALGWLVGFPLLKHFSLSIAFTLKKKDIARAPSLPQSHNSVAGKSHV